MNERYVMEDLEAKGGIGGLDSDLPDDVFVVSASYEERCLAFGRYLAGDYHPGRAVVYFNKEFVEDEALGGHAARNLDEMQRELWKHTPNIELLPGSWLQPIEQLTAIRGCVDAFAKDGLRRITIDATAFTRESLLVFIGLLRHRLPGSQVRVLYVSPTGHGDWLSKGCRQVRNVIGYGGLHDPRRATLLLVLSGFEPERVVEQIEAHEPALVLLGLGHPPTDQSFYERNVSDMSVVLGRQAVKCFEFPADDLIRCAEAVEFEFAEYRSTHNIVVAPMSTKLSTIGALLAVEHWPEVQITYAVPLEYNAESYSRGAKELFAVLLPSQSSVIQVE